MPNNPLKDTVFEIVENQLASDVCPFVKAAERGKYYKSILANAENPGSRIINTEDVADLFGVL